MTTRAATVFTPVCPDSERVPSTGEQPLWVRGDASTTRACARYLAREDAGDATKMGYVRDTCICRARHIHLYAASLIISSNYRNPAV